MRSGTSGGPWSPRLRRAARRPAGSNSIRGWWRPMPPIRRPSAGVALFALGELQRNGCENGYRDGVSSGGGA